jgi:hypothetical protein
MCVIEEYKTSNSSSKGFQARCCSSKRARLSESLRIASPTTMCLKVKKSGSTAGGAFCFLGACRQDSSLLSCKAAFPDSVTKCQTYEHGICSDSWICATCPLNLHRSEWTPCRACCKLTNSPKRKNTQQVGPSCHG